MAPRQFTTSTDTGKSDDSAYNNDVAKSAMATDIGQAEKGRNQGVIGLHGSSARLTEIVPTGGLVLQSASVWAQPEH